MGFQFELAAVKTRCEGEKVVCLKENLKAQVGDVKLGGMVNDFGGEQCMRTERQC